MLAGRGDDRPPAAGRAGLGEGTWARPRSSSRASSPVPTTWKAKSLSIRTRTPSPSGVEQFAQPNRWSSTGSAARANRSRWKARSTTVATHQPVIGSLRSSNRPAATSVRPRARRRAERRGEGRGERPGGALDRRRRTGGASAVAALARDRRRDDAGHPARVDEVEVGEVDGHVEGDPVVADAALDAQAERADLARRRAVRVAPAAGVAVAPAGRDAEGRAGRDERRLEGADERPDQQAAVARRDDRIGHELARAVVRHLAAALDPDDLDAARGAASPRSRQDVRRVGRAGRGSGPPGARAAGAGRRSRRRRARPRGASGGPAPRDSRCARAMSRRSAPARGSTRSARGPASRSPRPHDSRTRSSGRVAAGCPAEPDATGCGFRTGRASA